MVEQRPGLLVAIGASCLLATSIASAAGTNAAVTQPSTPQERSTSARTGGAIPAQDTLEYIVENQMGEPRGIGCEFLAQVIGTATAVNPTGLPHWVGTSYRPHVEVRSAYVCPGGSVQSFRSTRIDETPNLSASEFATMIEQASRLEVPGPDVACEFAPVYTVDAGRPWGRDIRVTCAGRGGGPPAHR